MQEKEKPPIGEVQRDDVWEGAGGATGGHQKFFWEVVVPTVEEEAKNVCERSATQGGGG